MFFEAICPARGFIYRWYTARLGAHCSLLRNTSRQSPRLVLGKRGDCAA